MKYALLVWVGLVMATLACSLTRDGSDPSTPTPVAGIGQLQTNTAAVTQTATAGSPTPIAAPPTRLPTLFPTPRQFNTPIPNNNVGQPPPLVVGNNSTSGNGQLAAVSGDPAAGAPQNNGFYFPDTIVYSSGGSVLAVSEAGGGGSPIGSGLAARSLNGLYVATSGNGIVVVRPDGAAVTTGSGQTTLPTWSKDGSTAYWGNGSNLIRYQGGAATTISNVSGSLSKVEYSPDGGTVLFASTTQIKLLYGDGNVGTLWTSGAGESIIEGPFWATRNGTLGIYARLSDGRRVFMSGDFSILDNPNEQIQTRSPLTEGGRAYIRAENGGNGYLMVAVFPDMPDREFLARSPLDISWSPDGAQLVYATPDGQLMLLDLPSGQGRVLASGGVTQPIWSPAQYLVK